MEQIEVDSLHFNFFFDRIRGICEMISAVVDSHSFISFCFRGRLRFLVFLRLLTFPVWSFFTDAGIEHFHRKLSPMLLHFPFFFGGLPSSSPTSNRWLWGCSCSWEGGTWSKTPNLTAREGPTWCT